MKMGEQKIIIWILTCRSITILWLTLHGVSGLIDCGTFCVCVCVWGGGGGGGGVPLHN